MGNFKLVIKKKTWIRIIVFIVLMAIIGVTIYLFPTTQLSDRLWLRHVYGDIRPLDEQGRCLVVELNKNQSKGKKCDLKFYDTQKREFVHLDLFRDIKEAKEIRPGYYALYDRHGLQTYSIVMPYASEAYGPRIDDEIQGIDCMPSEWFRQDDDSTAFKLSHNIREAESELIKLYEESGYCGYALIDYVNGNTSSLEYDFSRLNEKTNVSVLTSKDGNVRFYTWDTGTGGTSPNFAAYVQYNGDGLIKTKRFTPFAKSKYVCSIDVRKDGYEPYDGAWIDGLYQIDQSNGKPIYITCAYNKASGSEGGQDIFALQIIDGKLQKTPFIDKDGEQALTVGCYYYIPDWYFTTDGLGRDWIPSFDSETNTLYVPEDGDMEMSDRYDKYQLVDDKMKYIGNGAGFWLHPSLHEFKKLCGIYQTKTKLIRVDLLANGDYRYASWSKKNAMAKEPELVLTGAKTDLIENALVFEKVGYQYIVPAYRRGNGDDFGKFIIKKNGKIIQEVDV